jgi:prolyl oligopeptidase
MPVFSPPHLAWLERGGIYALAHTRGGGEYGELWHKEGQFGKKQNSIDDFIACAEYLIGQGYTSPAHLAAQTGSAGGMTVGSAVMQRPELFAAVVLRSASLDRLRMESTEGGPANTHEFGTVKVREDVKSLLAMSPYYHVQDGTAYPAVLLTAGMNDRRVPIWQSAKMTARLQRASSSGRPILLRVEYDAGHGANFGSTKAQVGAELADIMAFMFWQTGYMTTKDGAEANAKR